MNRTCPSCRATVPAANVFCGSCGHRLGLEAAAPDEASTLFTPMVSMPEAAPASTMPDLRAVSASSPDSTAVSLPSVTAASLPVTPSVGIPSSLALDATVPFAPPPSAPVPLPSAPVPLPIAPVAPVAAPTPPVAVPLLPPALGRSLDAERLLGLPLSFLTTPSRQTKVLLVAALVLLASRFFPASFSPWVWVWDGGILAGLVWPALAAAGYGFVVIAPPPLRQSLHVALFHWLPFWLAYLGIGLSGLPLDHPLYIWTLPLFLAGQVALTARPDDGVVRAFTALTGLLAFIGAMLGVRFSGMPGVFVFHNVLLLLVGFAILGSLALVAPVTWAPQLARLHAFRPLWIGALVVWPVLSLVLRALGLPGVLKLTVLVHGGVVLFAFLAIVLLCAPAVLADIAALLSGALVTSAGAASPAAAAPPLAQPPLARSSVALPAVLPPPPSAGPSPAQVAALAALDVEWAGGQMTPAQYHERRAAILAG